MVTSLNKMMLPLISQQVKERQMFLFNLTGLLEPVLRRNICSLGKWR
jgi:hypothetical protein